VSRNLITGGTGLIGVALAERLLARVRGVESEAETVEARFIHFVHVARPLEDHEEARLAALLTYGEPGPDAAPAAAR